jgi:D-glycero-D-manno-heptose 1,7-bisphosphate phosphatase
MQPAIFIDRDGVIIENREHYVRVWEDVTLLPSSVKALASAAAGPWKVVIVTNQAGIGKGIIAGATANEINHKLRSAIQAQGGRIDGIYVCPHTVEDNCPCRKPKPGLLLQAAADLSIDLSASIMIGDALTDIQAGQNAGVARQILVQTGRGAAQALLPAAQYLAKFEIFPDLLAAISSINA